MLKTGRLDAPASDVGSPLHAALKAGMGAAEAAAGTIELITDLGVGRNAAMLKILRDGLLGAFAAIPVNLPLGLLTNWISDSIQGKQSDGATQCCCRCDADKNGGSQQGGDPGSDLDQSSGLPPPDKGASPMQAEWRFDSGAHRGARLVQPLSWEQIVTQARQNRGLAVLLSASTDRVGAAPYNDRLSQRRAASIAAMLRDSGIARHQLFESAHGEDADGLPVATGDGQAEAGNRAVRVWLSREPSPLVAR